MDNSGEKFVLSFAIFLTTLLALFILFIKVSIDVPSLQRECALNGGMLIQTGNTHYECVGKPNKTVDNSKQ